MSTVAVIGGGVAGLTIAYKLAGRHNVVLFESESVPGGKMRSQMIDGYTFDWGPNGFLSNASEVLELVHDLGLGDVVTEANHAAKNRYIYWNGHLHRVPAKPQEALRMSLLTPFGKLRALGDLFSCGTPSQEDGAADESVSAFMSRHFGREVAERLVAPAVLGISSGDAAQTSIAALFPRVIAMEREHRSVLRAVAKSRAKGPRMTSFGSLGMQRLTDRLGESLGDRVRLATPVACIERRGEGWRVAHAGGEMHADAVVVATPADAAAALVEGFDAALASELRAIPYSAMRAIGIAFRAEDVATPLDGFGFLAARGQGVRILGAVYTSTVYPQQAPPDTAYLRIFMGGATDPGVAALDAADVERIVRADLARILGITAAPVAFHEMTWPQAIPQYTLRHRSVVANIAARTPARFAFAGNAYRGLGVGDDVRDAIAVAAAIDRELAESV